MRKLMYFLASGLMAFAMAGCQETDPENNEPENPQGEKSTITVEPMYEEYFKSGLELSPNGGKSLISFTAAEDWTVDVEDTKASTWLSVSKTSGSAGPVDLLLSSAGKSSTKLTATLTITCGSTKKSMSVSKPAFQSKGVKASYDDFLGTWYVSGTLGVYFQQFHEIEPYEITSIVTVEKNEDGKTYYVKGWETPATLKDAEHAYYSCIHKDKNGQYLDNITTYLSSIIKGEDMSIDAYYDSEFGLMTFRPQVFYTATNVSVELGVSYGEVGTHTYSYYGEGDYDIAHFWKQSDGSISVVDPEGRTKAVAMAFMRYEGSMSAWAMIFNSVPDFPMTMKKAVNPVTRISFDTADAFAPLAKLNVGDTFQAAAKYEPSNADGSRVEWYSENPEVATVDKNGLITAVGAGSTPIFVYADGKWAKSSVSVAKSLVYTAPASAVDLGLPSGTKWAPYNMGGSAPEDYGGYYAWGETETKDEYTEENYKFYEKGRFNRNGQPDPNGSYSGRYTKYTGSDDILEPQDDVAQVKWGNGWRMPNYDEILELIESCSFKNENLNGINGVRVTGPNGNSIFFPYAGEAIDHYEPVTGEHLVVYSSQGFRPYNPDPYNASACIFHTNFTTIEGHYDIDNGVVGSRKDGCSVRPVR